MKEVGELLYFLTSFLFNFSKIEDHILPLSWVVKLGTGNPTILLCPSLSLYVPLLPYIQLTLNSPVTQ